MRQIIWSPTGSLTFDLFRLACHGLTGLIFLSFLGSFIPLGDSLAVFRIEMTVLLGLFGLYAFTHRRSLIPAIAAVTVSASTLSILPFVPDSNQSGPYEITVHQHNVLFSNPDRTRLIMAIRDQMPTAVTLQELDGRNVTMIKTLAKTHSHFHVCEYDSGGVGVFVQEIGPMLGSGCVDTAKLAWVRVDTSAGPVTFVSIHLFWPWPRGQFTQVEAYSADIAALPQPVILGGDFNMVPWAASVRQIAVAAEGEVIPGIKPTYHLGGGWPWFRIDHVVAPEGAMARVERLGKLGSDHNGLFARIALPNRVRRSASRP